MWFGCAKFVVVIGCAKFCCGCGYANFAVVRLRFLLWFGYAKFVVVVVCVKFLLWLWSRYFDAVSAALNLLWFRLHYFCLSRPPNCFVAADFLLCPAELHCRPVTCDGAPVSMDVHNASMCATMIWTIWSGLWILWF